MKSPATAALAALIMLVLMLSASGCTGYGENHYVVGVYPGLQPFMYYDDKGHYTGLDYDSMLYVADDQGFTVEFKPVEWSKITSLLVNGDIDIVYSAMSITKNRELIVAFTDPYWQSRTSMASPAGKNHTFEEAEQTGLAMALLTGASGLEWVHSKYIDTGIVSEDNVKNFMSFDEAFSYITENHPDDGVVIADYEILGCYVDAADFKITDTVLVGDKYAAAVRKSDTELLEKLNTGIKNLQNSEKWQELLKKYNMD